MTPATRRKVRAVMIMSVVVVLADTIVAFAVAFAFAALHGAVPPIVMPLTVLGLTVTNVAVMMTAPRHLVRHWEFGDWENLSDHQQVSWSSPARGPASGEDHRAP